MIYRIFLHPRWLFGISSINHSLNVIYVRRIKDKLYVILRSLSFGLQKKEVRFNSIKSRWCLISIFTKNGLNATCSVLINHHLPGGFKNCLFSSLPGEMIQFDEHIFQMGWNHKPVTHEIFTIQASWCWTHQRDIPILMSIFFRWVETTNQHKFLPIPNRLFGEALCLWWSTLLWQLCRRPKCLDSYTEGRNIWVHKRRRMWTKLVLSTHFTQWSFFCSCVIHGGILGLSPSPSSNDNYTGWWFQLFFIFTPIPGEMF